MTNKTKSVIRTLLYIKFYEEYGYYIADVEFEKECPDLHDKEINKIYKKNCNEIITALAELKEITFEAAEKELIDFYNYMKEKKEV